MCLGTDKNRHRAEWLLVQSVAVKSDEIKHKAGFSATDEIIYFLHQEKLIFSVFRGNGQK